MFGRKRAHLVERAVERLAQSGELDSSSAHLLEPDQHSGQAFPHDASAAAPVATVFDEVHPLPRDSLRAGLHGSQAVALAELEPSSESDPLAERVTPIADQAPEADAAPFGAADVDDLTDAPLAEPGPHTLMPGEEGAAQPFVDMTSLFRAGMIDWNRVRSRVSEDK